MNHESATSPGAEPASDEGNELLLGGLGVLAIGALGAIAGGAVCPVCVVATPALLGAGAYKKWQARRARQADEPSPRVSPRRPP